MKIDRLVSMIMILLEKERIGAQELADLFEVSPRTIYRDIDSISMAGIPVRATPGVGGGFEIMQEYKMDRKVFSAADLSAILMGLTGLSSMMRGDELVNALAKVRSFIPADRAKDIEFKSNQVLIDLSSWMGSRTVQPYLELVKIALEESRLLSFAYIDRYGNVTERVAEPYQLVLKGDDWYVQAYCYIRDDYRIFKLARMSSLLVSEETFSPREYQTPQLDFADTLAKLQIRIKLRVHASAISSVLGECTVEHISFDGDTHYIVDFPFIENDYYYGILLSFGDKCECLEPEHIRAEMKRRIGELAALYEDEHVE